MEMHALRRQLAWAAGKAGEAGAMRGGRGGAQTLSSLTDIAGNGTAAGTQQDFAERSLRHWRHPRVLGVAES
jgi:hypothetical protein